MERKKRNKKKRDEEYAQEVAAIRDEAKSFAEERKNKKDNEARRIADEKQ